MESLLFIVEKKVNILNYTLHFLWKQNLCGCRTLRDFRLLLVEETAPTHQVSLHPRPVCSRESQVSGERPEIT